MSKPKAPPPDPFLEAQKKKAAEEEARREAEEAAHKRQELHGRRTGQRGAMSLLSGTFLGFPEGGTGVGTSQKSPPSKPIPDERTAADDRKAERGRKKDAPFNAFDPDSLLVRRVRNAT